MRPVLLALPLVLIVGATSTLGQPGAPAEEFLGPFASWNQVQCSGADDTAILQAALDVLGTPGNSPVLYIKPGACRITSTLVLAHREKISILGADPATTTIVWAGPPGTSDPWGRMFWANGVGHSRFGRITWDHGGIPGLIFDSTWDGKGCCFPTDNRHEDEVYQGLVQPTKGQFNVAFAGGRGPTFRGDAETEWLRSRFVGPMDTGIFLGNANVLDYWVWDSVFQNVHYGVSNATDQFLGGGGYAVNRSIFLGTTGSDLQLANTNFFSARWNYSNGSQFIGAGPIGKAPAPFTVQGNTVLDTPDDHNIIDMGNPGPLLLLDNTMRSNLAHIKIGDPYAGQNFDGDITSLGNTFSRTNPFQTGSATRLREVDDTLGATISDPGQPAPPPTPQTQNRPVFEPSTLDTAGIQDAVNQAVASAPRAVVHLPYGNYAITATIEVPANATIQITGDGQDRTNLGAAGATDSLVHFAGPTKATIRDLSLHGDDHVQGLSITNADQPGGVIHTEGLLGGQNAVGVLLDGVAQTAIDLLDNQTSATSSADFRLRNGAKATVFNGAGSGSTGSVYDLQQNSTLIVQTMYFENTNPVQFVAPNGSGTLVLDDGKLQGAPGTTIDVSSFSGLATIQNQGVPDQAPVNGGADYVSLGLIVAGQQSYAGGPSAIWSARTDTGGGGSKQASEQSSGVTDEAAMLRQHEAPLQSAVPKTLGDNGAGVTDFHLYRVSGDRMSALFSVQSAGDSAGVSRTPSATASRASLPIPPSTTQSAQMPGATTGAAYAPTSTSAFVTAVSDHTAVRNDYGDFLGIKISTRAKPITVTALGRYVETGNSHTHPLAIYRATDGVEIARTMLDLAKQTKDSSGFAYAPLAKPVTLQAGTAYYVVSGETVGGDSFEGGATYPKLTHTPVASVEGAIYRRGTKWLTGPGSKTNRGYIPMSFRYQATAAT